MLYAIAGAAREGRAGAARRSGSCRRCATSECRLNLLLIAFNLLPIPPLDGSHVFKYLLPASLAVQYLRFGRYGIIASSCCSMSGSDSCTSWMRAVRWRRQIRVRARERRRRSFARPCNGCDDGASAYPGLRVRRTRRRRRSSSSSPQFSGPLDLLLSLIRDEQVDIYDIPIARIARAVPRAHPHAAARTRRPTISRWPRACFASRRRCCCRGPRRGGVGRSARRARATPARVSADARGGGRPRARVARIGATGSRARTSRRRPRRRRRRSRCRSASCSPPSIACCASRANRTFTTSCRAPLDVDGAIATIRAVLALRARARWTDVVRARRRAVAGAFGAARAARAGEARRAARRAAAPFRQRGDHS